MQDNVSRIYARAQMSIGVVKERCLNFFRSEDEGSFLTENLGVVAITIALVAIILAGMIVIIGTAGSGGSGILGTLTTRITDFFTGS